MTHLSEYYSKMKDVGLRMNHQFLVNIPRLGTDFKFFATSASLPGRTVEENEVPFHGVTFRTPSVTTYEGTMDINVRSDIANEIRTNIEVWANDHANLAMGGGGKKRIPIEVATLDLLDETLGNAYRDGTEEVLQSICPGVDGGASSTNTDGCTKTPFIRSYTLVGVFPGAYGEISMDTTSPDISEFSLTLKYQYWYESTGNVKRDPLG